MDQTMGGTCSMQRQRALWREEDQSHSELRRGLTSNVNSSPSAVRRSSRHSVVAALPDGSIASLYPTGDNYVNVNGERRSPKSLAELCTDAVCRSMCLLNGALPPRLPQDVVDDIVESLIKHSALNATTLRVLKNCELGTLRLAGARGVTDEWLKPLASRIIVGHDHTECMDVDYPKASPELVYGTFDSIQARVQEQGGEEAESRCSRSTSSFVSATSDLAEPETEHGLDDGHSSFLLMTAGAPLFQDAIMKGERSGIQRTELTSPTSYLTLLDLRGSQRLTDKGLLQLSNLCQLEVARLDNCHSIVGRGLVAFSMSRRLHTLSLANCRRLTDEAVINVSHLLSLEKLDLSGCRCLTDRSLAAIAGLLRLQKLDMSQCDLISDAGIEHLETNEALEELCLGWCRSLTNRGLNSLTLQPGRSESLKVLCLARCMVTDDGVGYLGRLAHLEELDLNGCSNIGSLKLGKALERMPNLQRLNASYCPGILLKSWQGQIQSLKTLEVCYSGVKDSHLANLVNLPALEELNLDSCPVGDWAIAHLADNNVVPSLKSLNLADTDLTDLGMVHLPKFSNLTRLSLFYCNITNGGLRYISELAALEELNLDSREISDSGLCHLRQLHQLRSLDVFSGRVTDSGCAHISRIKSLESLELCGGGVGDLGCSLLSGLENLTSLNLSQNDRITNRGASAFAALKNLKALNLSNTRVDASSRLRLPKSLQSLALYGCRGINECNGMSLLQTDLPSLKCLRLNSTRETNIEDGTMAVDHEDEDVGSDYSGYMDDLDVLVDDRSFHSGAD